MKSFSSLVLEMTLPRFLHRGFGLRPSGVYGEARWMNLWERGRFFSGKHTGLVFAPKRRMSEQESCRNLALVAPTGSGKTTRYVIPNLLSLQGSAVVTDPSGEIYRQTSGWLHQQGFSIRVIQPADAEHSLQFNPLSYLKGHHELGDLARTIARWGNQGEQEAGGGDGAFWTNGAADILRIGLNALINTADPRLRNLGNLRSLLNRFGSGGEGVAEFLTRHLDEMQRVELLGFIQQDPKVMASMVSTARAGLDLFSNPDICRLTSSDTVGIEDIRRRKTVVYLIVPENRIRYFSPILNLFYSSCFAHCLQSWDQAGENQTALLPVYFFLDEFGNLGRIANFGGIITTLRRRRCSVSLIIQEPSQLEATYGRLTAGTILSGGCANKLYFSGLDKATAEDVERRLGSETVWSMQDNGTDSRYRLTGKPLLRAEEIRRMPGDHGILISGRERPALLRMPAFYEVEAWQRQAALPPFPLPGEAGYPGGPSGNAEEVMGNPMAHLALQ